MAGSFWSNFGLRFNASSSNGIDELLERGEGNFTLQEVLLHDQCIQEAKYMNQQLCDYLSQPAVVAQLVRYVVTVPPEARQPKGPGEVGGGIDSGGGITTAASLKHKADKARAAIAAAQAANQTNTEGDSAAAAKPADADAASDSAAATSAASNSTDAVPAADSDSSREEEEARAKADAESSDRFGHRRNNSSGSDSDSDEDHEHDSAEAQAARAAETALENEQKFPYLASELFACEVPAMLDAIFEDGDSISRRSSVHSVSALSAHSPLVQVDEEAEGNDTDKASMSGADGASAAAASGSGISSAAAGAVSPSSLSLSPSGGGAASGPRRLPILDLLLSFLDQAAPIEPAHASYFRKVLVVLIQRKYEPLVRYMAAHGTIDKLLRHIGVYSCFEIIVMIGWDDGLGGNQDVAWLVDADLTGKLIEKLRPTKEDAHASAPALAAGAAEGAAAAADSAAASAAPAAALLAARARQDREEGLINASRALVDVVVKCPASSHNPLITRLLSTSCLSQLFAHMFSGSSLSLSNALSVVIVLVQRYANRMDLGEAIMDEAKAAALAHQAASLDAPDDEDSGKAQAGAAAAAVAAVSAAADSGDSPSADGSSRLAEPFHSLVPHLSRILRLLETEAPAETTWSYGSGRAFGETRLKVVELVLVLVRCRVPEVEQIFVAEGLMQKLLDAFFRYPWNNMLHGLVESIIRTTLEFLPADTPLKPALFVDAQMAEAVMAAYEANSVACKDGPGFRLGYMGHLLRTADVIEQYLKLAESEQAGEVAGESASSIRERILGGANVATAWDAFVFGPLSIETENQRVVLPSMGDDADDFDDHDAMGMGMGDLTSFQQHAQQHKLSGDAGGDGDAADYAFDPDGDGGGNYDYGSHMEMEGGGGGGGADGDEWANFNTDFADAPMGAGSSPNQQQQQQQSEQSHGRPVDAGSVSLSSPAAQRKLLEFSLNPDEDADSDDDDTEDELEVEEEGAADDWANFDSPAAAAPATSSNETNAAVSSDNAEPTQSSAGSDASAAPAAVAATGDDDDFSDFAVEFPPPQ